MQDKFQATPMNAPKSLEKKRRKKQDIFIGRKQKWKDKTAEKSGFFEKNYGKRNKVWHENNELLQTPKKHSKMESFDAKIKRTKNLDKINKKAFVEHFDNLKIKY